MQAQITKAENSLRRKCPVIRDIIKSHGPCTIAKNKQPHFHSLVWSIINQQLSVKAALAIEKRVKAELGVKKNFSPKHFKSATQPQLRSCGLSNSKARFILAIREFVESGKLPLRSIAKKDDPEVSDLLLQVPGIGPWTADMFMMFSLNRPDILPLGDLALRKAIRIAYELDDDCDYATLTAATDHLRPWRTVASWYLWCLVD